MSAIHLLTAFFSYIKFRPHLLVQTVTSQNVWFRAECFGQLLSWFYVKPSVRIDTADGSSLIAEIGFWAE